MVVTIAEARVVKAAVDIVIEARDVAAGEKVVGVKS